MHKNDLDVQRAQDSDVEQNVRKVFRTKNLAIDCDHENLVPETRDILKNSAKLRQFHCENNSSKLLRSKSSALLTMRSATLKSWRSLNLLGMATAFIPACLAARQPGS